MNHTFFCHICQKQIQKSTKSHIAAHGITLESYELLFGADDFTPCNYRLDLPHSFRCLLNTDSENKFCILHSKNTDKDYNLFQNTLTALITLYRKQNSEYHLEGIHFPGDIDFSQFKFDNNVFFYECAFHGNIIFKNTFAGNFDIRKSVFHQNADFSRSEFLKDTKFSHSIFYQNALFYSTGFHDYTRFWDVRFEGNVYFRYAKFYGQVSFGDCIGPDFPNELHFIATKFYRPDQTLFSGMNFSTTLFRWAELTGIKFENAQWARTSRLKGARIYLLDENFADNKQKKLGKYKKRDYYKFAEDLYQELKRNFEEKRNYREAGDFYIGEMECHRKSNFFRRYLPSLVNLYRISSCYGQRYIRAGVILLLLLLFFAGAHLAFGLKPNPHNSYHAAIHYSIQNPIQNPGAFCSDFLMSTVYCIEVIMREAEPDRLFRPASVAGELLNSFFSVIVYIQILFFILAIRRHFKR